MIVAIDPGREKCGVACVQRDGTLVWCEIWPRGEFATRLQVLVGVETFVLGHSTASAQIGEVVRSVFPNVPLHEIDETNSTLEARGVFWEKHPPRGWRALVPLSLQTPPRPIDDYAALVLAHRWLKSNVV